MEFRRIYCPACWRRQRAADGFYERRKSRTCAWTSAHLLHTHPKSIDQRKPGSPFPSVDELATIPLDLWAREQRPPESQINLRHSITDADHGLYETPCDAALMRSGDGLACAHGSGAVGARRDDSSGSSMAFIDGTVVNVAIPALQAAFHATVVDVTVGSGIVRAAVVRADLLAGGGILGALIRTASRCFQLAW